jgi:threonine/homoserine/homoserine lactone efflux protein
MVGELHVPLALLTVLSLLIIAVAIPGLVFTVGISNGVSSSRCAFFSAMGDLALQKGNQWPGLNTIVS